jgi:adenosylmethionine-8-amino-7-oxononanoate aminotransferase
VANTNRFRSAFTGVDPGDDAAFSAAAADAVEQAIVMEGPDTVAAVFLEPVQNAGGCIPPPPGYFGRVREICDRHGVLLVSDEVICAYGRLGSMFGCDRYGYQPDLITTAKGLTSGYSPLGAVIVSDRVAEPFLADPASFAHGLTFGGHPVGCAVALANLDLFEQEGVLDHVRGHEDGFRARLDGLRDIPLVGDVRGAGYFWALELVPDPDDHRIRFTAADASALVGDLAPRLAEAGLLCRAIDRGDPVVQLSPPLIAGDGELDEIEAALRTALTETWKRRG